jgi:hypothetical protein
MRYKLARSVRCEKIDDLETVRSPSNLNTPAISGTISLNSLQTSYFLSLSIQHSISVCLYTNIMVSYLNYGINKKNKTHNDGTRGNLQSRVSKQPSFQCHIFYANNPTTAYEKVAWYDGANFNNSLLGASVILFLSTLIWPIGFIFNRCPTKTMSVKLGRAAR